VRAYVTIAQHALWIAAERGMVAWGGQATPQREIRRRDLDASSGVRPARRATDPPTPDPTRRRPSARKREVALLVTDHLNDETAGERLGLSPTTALERSRAQRCPLSACVPCGHAGSAGPQVATPSPERAYRPDSASEGHN